MLISSYEENAFLIFFVRNSKLKFRVQKFGAVTEKKKFWSRNLKIIKKKKEGRKCYVRFSKQKHVVGFD